MLHNTSNFPCTLSYFVFIKWPQARSMASINKLTEREAEDEMNTVKCSLISSCTWWGCSYIFHNHGSLCEWNSHAILGKMMQESSAEYLIIYNFIRIYVLVNFKYHYIILSTYCLNNNMHMCSDLLEGRNQLCWLVLCQLEP